MGEKKKKSCQSWGRKSGDRKHCSRTGQVEKASRLFPGSWSKMWLKLLTIVFCKVFEQGVGRKD